MLIRPIAPQISTRMSRPAAEQPLPPPRGAYPLRRVARFFAATGIAAFVYASALVALAIQSSIIEF